MSEATAPLTSASEARDVLDGVRYVVLGTIDEDGRTRTSPVYFTPHGYEDLYWVSYPTPTTRTTWRGTAGLSGVVFDSTRPPGRGRAVYVTGTAREVPGDELVEHLPMAFDPEGRGGRRVRPRGADRRRRPAAVGAARRAGGRCTSAPATRRSAPAATGGCRSIPSGVVITLTALGYHLCHE